LYSGRVGSITSTLRDVLKVETAGDRICDLSSSAVKDEGDADEIDAGAGRYTPEGMLFMNNPSSNTEGIRGEAIPGEGVLWLCSRTSLLETDISSRQRGIEEYSNPYPPLKKTRRVCERPANVCKYSLTLVSTPFLLPTSIIAKEGDA